AGFIGSAGESIDQNGNSTDPMLDFGTPIAKDEQPVAALYRAIDDGLAEGLKLRLIQATRRRDLGLQFLLFHIEQEGDLHLPARLYVVDAASGNICCKGDLSTYLTGNGR